MVSKLKKFVFNNTKVQGTYFSASLSKSTDCATEEQQDFSELQQTALMHID